MSSLKYIASDQIRFHCEVSIPARKIEHYRFLYVESGQGRFRIADRHFDIKGGWLGLLAPGWRENHYAEVEPVSYLFVEFSSRSRLLQSHWSEMNSGDPQRSTLIWLMRTIDDQKHDDDGYLLNAAVRLMFPAPASKPQSNLDPRLAAVVSCVQLHPERNVTVAELASVARVSEAHLRRLFRTQLKTSPKQFLLKTRMEFARRLLSLEGLRAGEVARLLGFETVFHFSAQYRHVIGHPPSDDYAATTS